MNGCLKLMPNTLYSERTMLSKAHRKHMLGLWNCAKYPAFPGTLTKAVFLGRGGLYMCADAFHFPNQDVSVDCVALPCRKTL